MIRVGDELHDRYTIEAPMASGGMAAIFRAKDSLKDRQVAIKELRMDHLPADPAPAEVEGTRQRPSAGLTRQEALKQFKREAQILCKLHHPNLPEVDDYFVYEDRGYIVMTLIIGRDLLEVLSAHSPLAESQLLAWLPQILSALEYCHQQKIFHRDLKPENILLTAEGHLYIVDFGIAKSLALSGEGTTVGARGITPGYSPPEQYSSLNATDARSDLYALGATLYHLLTGLLPPESVVRQAGTLLITPRSLNPLISERMEKLILHCMELEQSRRPSSAGEIQSDLSEWSTPAPQSIAYRVTAAPGSAIRESISAPVTRQPAGGPGNPASAARAGEPLTRGEFNPQMISRLKEIPNPDGAIRHLAFAASGRTLASAAAGATILRLWSFEPHESDQTLAGFSNPIGGLAFSRVGRSLAVCAEDGSILLWNLDQPGRDPRAISGRASTCLDLDFSPAHSLLACADADGRLRIYDTLVAGVLLKTLELQPPLQPGRKITFSPDGRWLAAGGGGTEVQIFAVEDWKPFRSIPGEGTRHLTALRFSPDGACLAVGYSGKILIWDLVTFKWLRVIENGRGDVSSLAFSPDGSLLASGNTDHEVNLCNPATGRKYRGLPGHKSAVTCVSFSADGCLLASGSTDGTIRLWGTRD